MDFKSAILDIVRREGPISLYYLAKALGVSYGTAQWYVYIMEREGLVSTVKVGRRRYVVLRSSDWLSKIRVGDILEEFMLTLAAYGVKPDMTFEEAIKILGKKSPHVAELLYKIVAKDSRLF